MCKLTLHITRFIFCPRGHGNELSNLIGSLRYLDFPISGHDHSNAYVSFCPFVCKAIEVQKLFLRQLLIGHES